MRYTSSLTFSSSSCSRAVWDSAQVEPLMLMKLAPCCSEGLTSLASWSQAVAAGIPAPAASALGWERRFTLQTRSKGGLTPEPVATSS
eukprot:6241541-Pyramimonas_sp.AAC.1